MHATSALVLVEHCIRHLNICTTHILHAILNFGIQTSTVLALPNVVIVWRAFVGEQESASSDGVDGGFLSSQNHEMAIAIQDAIATRCAFSRHGMFEGEGAGADDEAGETAAKHTDSNHEATKPILNEGARNASACRGKHWEA